VAAFDPATGRAIVERTLQRLADFDADAADDLDTHRDVFRALLGHEGFAAFEGHVQGYALGDAHAALEAALNAHTECTRRSTSRRASSVPAMDA
jgi:hypothetical protein